MDNIFILKIIATVIVILLCLLVIAYVFKYECSTTRFENAEVLEVTFSDSCYVVLKTQYYVEYDRLFLGFYTFRAKFAEENCGYGDCYWTTVTRTTVAEIIKDFSAYADNKVVKKETKSVKNIQNKDCK